MFFFSNTPAVTKSNATFTKGSGITNCCSLVGWECVLFNPNYVRNGLWECANRQTYANSTLVKISILPRLMASAAIIGILFFSTFLILAILLLSNLQNLLVHPPSLHLVMISRPPPWQCGGQLLLTMVDVLSLGTESEFFRDTLLLKA